MERWNKLDLYDIFPLRSSRLRLERAFRLWSNGDILERILRGGFLKVALIHDWLTGMRGGEKVLEVLCEIFPEADLYTIFHVPGSVSGIIENRKVVTSFIQRLPGARTRYRSFLPLFPMAVEGFNLSGYDLVVSSSHCAAKGGIPPSKALHVSYVHTPMRYVWDMYNDYFGPERTGFLKRKMIGVFSHYLRMWDITSSARVDHYIANSAHVARRIEKFYRRGSSIIHPPVDCSRFTAGKGDGGYYLVVSAFAPYKRIDIAVDAFNMLGKRLVIIGSGQDEKLLKSKASSNIEFLGWKPDNDLAAYYAGCKALLFTGEEDFGIVPLEAMASGRPVIAYAKGGALETVVAPGSGDNGPTGLFFNEQTAGSLIEAVRAFEASEALFVPERVRRHALKFDRPLFKERLKEHIFGLYNGHRVKVYDA